MDRDATVRLVRRFYDDLWTRADVATADEILEPEMLFVLPFARFQGREALKSLVVANHRAFAGLTYHTTADGVILDGRRAACEWRMTGRQVAEWNGIPATGREVEIPGMTLFELGASGQIREARVHNHYFGLLAQLGAVTMRHPEQDSAAPHGA
jgi:predicted ester cyclase